MDSILQSVKKILGISSEYTIFDQDIIMHINAAFSILNQLGIGPIEGYVVVDEKDVWSDFIDDDPRLELVKVYTAYKVRVLFDPPSSSFVLNAFNTMLVELEWRLTVAAESTV